LVSLAIGLLWQQPIIAEFLDSNLATYVHVYTYSRREMSEEIESKRARADETLIAQLYDLLVDDVDIGLYDTIMHTCK
jgi:hypothetical protein